MLLTSCFSNGIGGVIRGGGKHTREGLLHEMAAHVGVVVGIRKQKSCISMGVSALYCGDREKVGKELSIDFVEDFISDWSMYGFYYWVWECVSDADLGGLGHDCGVCSAGLTNR